MSLHNCQVGLEAISLLLEVGHVAQSVTCLTTDASLGSEFDPGPIPYFRGD